MSSVPGIILNDGNTIPQLGFGVFQIDPADTAETVQLAFDAGYRHIDTAQMYGNEAEVGEAIAKSGIARDELWITTKCGNGAHGKDESQAALDESLRKLGLDVVDLYLIHWPLPAKDRYVDTWRGFEQAKADGRTRSIGVSNFGENHLERLRQETDTVPSVNQIELHPHMQQVALRTVDQRLGIATEAWSPIGQGKGLLDAPELADIASRHGRSAAQIVLRWHVQLGTIVFPKSVDPDRIRENMAIFDFELSEQDMAAIAGMEKAERVGPDPDTFNPS